MNLLARPTCCASSRTRVSRAEDTALHPPPYLWNLPTLAPDTYVSILKRYERAMRFACGSGILRMGSQVDRRQATGKSDMATMCQLSFDRTRQTTLPSG